MRKLVFLILLTSCGPVYIPVGFILPPSGSPIEDGQQGGGMYFSGGGYNSGDGISGVSLTYGRAASGPWYRLNVGLNVYGGEYYASGYGDSYSFGGIYGFMEPELRFRLLPYLALSTGIYGGLGSEGGSYISSIVSDRGSAAPVLRFSYTAGVEVGGNFRISARFYLGLPTALIFGLTGMERWMVSGGVAHSDGGTVFAGIYRRF